MFQHVYCWFCICLWDQDATPLTMSQESDDNSFSQIGFICLAIWLMIRFIVLGKREESSHKEQTCQNSVPSSLSYYIFLWWIAVHVPQEGGYPCPCLYITLDVSLNRNWFKGKLHKVPKEMFLLNSRFDLHGDDDYPGWCGPHLSRGWIIGQFVSHHNQLAVKRSEP